jgi:mannose-6-phosphate isomerase-like protein (cupin superfamily)
MHVAPREQWGWIMGTIGNRHLYVKHMQDGAADESVTFASHGHLDVHRMGDSGVMRAVFEPGWRWSKDMAERAGTKSCQVAHVGYVVSGRMKIVMDDGTEAEVGAGDAMSVEPGHDAWVIGDEPCVVLDFRGYDTYARRASDNVGTTRRQQEPEQAFRR